MWFIIGAVVGFAVAWYFQSQKCSAQLAERDQQIARLKTDLSAAQAAPREITPPEPRPLPPPPETKSEPDKLTRINGIGPVIHKKLNGLGIETFAQIAAFTQADIDRVNEQLSFKGRIERENWVEQAKKLARDG